MNNYTERTWALVTFNEEIGKLMKTYVKNPPRKLQSEALYWPDHDPGVPAVSVRAGAAGEGGGEDSAADGNRVVAKVPRPCRHDAAASNPTCHGSRGQGGHSLAAGGLFYEEPWYTTGVPFGGTGVEDSPARSTIPAGW